MPTLANAVKGRGHGPLVPFFESGVLSHAFQSHKLLFLAILLDFVSDLRRHSNKIHRGAEMGSAVDWTYAEVSQTHREFGILKGWRQRCVTKAYQPKRTY